MGTQVGSTYTLSGQIKTGSAPGQEQYTLDPGNQVKVLNTRNINGQNYYDVQQIGGGTGWTLGSTLDSSISANQIQAPVTNVPYTTDANANNIQGLNGQLEASRKALEAKLAEQQTQTQQQLDVAKASEQTAVTGMKENTTPFRSALETTQREQLGTDTVLSNQRSLLGELDQLLTEGNDLIRQQKEVTGLAAVRNPRIQKTMDDVSARAGVIQAVVNLQNTYLANAYQSIDRSVSAITQDRQDSLNYYQTVLNLANRDIVSLDAKSQDIAKQQVDLLKSDLDRAQTTSDYIKQLMINPDTAMALAQSGVTLNDTVEQINTKLSNYDYIQEIRDISNKMGTSGYSVVFNPKSVPADQLVTVEDSKGQKYYYRKAPAPTTGIDTNAFINKALNAAGINPNKTAAISDAQYQSIVNTVNGVVAPGFSPSAGIGSTYSDSMGRKWIYEKTGWRLLG